MPGPFSLDSPRIRRPSGFGRLELAFPRSNEGESLPPTPLHGVPPARPGRLVPWGTPGPFFGPNGLPEPLPNLVQISIPFLIALGAVLGPFWRPRWAPNRAPGDLFSVLVCTSERKPTKSQFRSHLRRCLEATNVKNPLVFCIFSLILHYAFRAPSESLWAPFGDHFWDPKRL